MIYVVIEWNTFLIWIFPIVLHCWQAWLLSIKLTAARLIRAANSKMFKLPSLLLIALMSVLVASYDNHVTWVGKVRWLDASNGLIPERSVAGGFIRSRNEPHYVSLRIIHDKINYQNVWQVCRARYGGDILPGKLVNRYKGCVVTWDGMHKVIPEYQTVMPLPNEHLRWVRAYYGSVPSCAIPIGRTSFGNPLYTGRLHRNNNYILGKINPRLRVFYYSDDIEEQKSNSGDIYDVLCIDENYLLNR